MRIHSTFNTRVSELTSITVNEMQTLYGAYELGDFMDRLLAELRGVEFGARDTSSVWVYYPEDTMPLGMICYGDFRDSGDMGEAFVVCARTIHNNKYSDYSGLQHNMKMSAKIEVALKNAKKYLRPWNSEDICRKFWGGAKSAWDTTKQKAEQPLSDLKEKVFDRRYGSMEKPFVAELLYLAKSGHQFMDAEFHTNIHEFIRLSEELKDLNTPHLHTFVRVYQKYGKTWADTMVVDDSKYGSPDLVNIVTYAENGEDGWEVIPEHILGRVSVLQMMTTEEYVLDVGINMGDGLFYVR